MLKAAAISLLNFLRGGCGEPSTRPMGGNDLDRLTRLRKKNEHRSAIADSRKGSFLSRVRYRRYTRDNETKTENKAKQHWVDCEPAYSVEGVVQNCAVTELYQKTVGKQTALWLEFSRILTSARRI